MPARSLFNIILKIAGVFFIGNILETFSRSLSVLVYFPQYASEKEAFFNLGVTIPPLILYTIFSWLLIFRTNSIIDLLKLDRFAGNETAGLQVHRSVVMTVAIMILGGWLIINELPEFFRHAVYYYQERKVYVRMAKPDISYMAASACKLLLGILILLFNRTLVNMLEVKRKRTTSWYWPLRIPFSKKKKKSSREVR